VTQTLPVISDKYEDVIDHCLKIAADEIHNHYKTIDATFLSKSPKAAVSNKKKKMQSRGILYRDLGIF
jgi:hypothetical protein